jgi:hypothetical protein
MALGRSNAAEAARVVIGEIRESSIQDAPFFERVETRFTGCVPAVINHSFVAYPADSCAVVGWGYWELDGRTSAEAERVVEETMKEFEGSLKGSLEDWLMEAQGWCGANQFTN